jgi:hypothetical protein
MTAMALSPAVSPRLASREVILRLRFVYNSLPLVTLQIIVYYSFWSQPRRTMDIGANNMNPSGNAPHARWK